MRIMLTALAVVVSSTGAFAADVKAGAATYEKACKSCHGADGAPNPAIAKMTKVEMRDLRSAEVQATSVADLKKVMTDGKGKMKPTPSVTGPALDDVVAYMKTMKK
jgi:mono/diheme cytochrome c family protein